MGFYLLCDWGLPILAGGQNVPPEGGSGYGFSMALLFFYCHARTGEDREVVGSVGVLVWGGVWSSGVFAFGDRWRWVSGKKANYFYALFSFILCEGFMP